MSQKFHDILEMGEFAAHRSGDQSSSSCGRVPAIVGIVATFTYNTLIHSACDLKATQMNMQHGLI